jgi:hypothetical protein
MTGTTSSGEYACIVLRHEESGSDFHLWTLQRPGQSVEIMSPTVPLDEVGTLYPGLLVPVIQHGECIAHPNHQTWSASVFFQCFIPASLCLRPRWKLIPASENVRNQAT